MTAPSRGDGRRRVRTWALFLRGVRDGLPIGAGYFAVSFAFGIQARAVGLGAWETLALSGSNLTSAGQFAGLSLIQAGASLAAMALTQLVINLRYCLMSCALSQKLAAGTPFWHRWLIAFGVTDEIFAVSAAVRGSLRPAYSYGLIAVSWPGWAGGSVLGVLAGNALPGSATNALSMALYAMFVAIVVPAAKADRRVLGVSLAAAVLSAGAFFAPGLSALSEGMRVVLATVAAAGAAALLRPVGEGRDG